jgi:hypothetical protein
MALQLKDMAFTDGAATDLIIAMDLSLAVYAGTLQAPRLASTTVPGYGVDLTQEELLAIFEVRATRAIADLVSREVQGIPELLLAFAETKKELQARTPPC